MDLDIIYKCNENMDFDTMYNICKKLLKSMFYVAPHYADNVMVFVTEVL